METDMEYVHFDRSRAGGRSFVVRSFNAAARRILGRLSFVKHIGPILFIDKAHVVAAKSVLARAGINAEIV